jgi:uncharacterized membrane protein
MHGGPNTGQNFMVMADQFCASIASPGITVFEVSEQTQLYGRSKVIIHNIFVVNIVIIVTLKLIGRREGGAIFSFSRDF